MQAIIMAGGEGSRLRPLTCDIPKPLAPLCGRPVLEYILDLLAEHRFDHAVMTLLYQGNKIISHFDGEDYKGIELSYSFEPQPLGTAGSVRHAIKDPRDDILVISGDALCDFDLTKAVAFHRQSRAAATLLVKRVEDPREYGLVNVTENGRIAGFLEKPSLSHCVTDLANTGIYILSPAVFDLIEEGKKVDFAQQVFPKMLEKKMPLYAYEDAGYWCDIGDLQSYVNCQRDMLQGKVRCSIDAPEVGGVFTKTELLSAQGAVRPPAYIGSNVQFGEGVQVEAGSVIGDNVTLGDGCRVKGGVILDGAHLACGASCVRGVIGTGAQMGKNSAVFECGVLGTNAVLGDESVVPDGIKVWEGKRVPDNTRLTDNLQYGISAGILCDEDGICGRTNVSVTPELCCKIGAALASLSEGAIIAVASGDTLSARALKYSAMSGVLSTGSNLWDFGVNFESQFDFCMLKSMADYGVYISSDGAARIKIVAKGGLPLPRSQERKLEGAVNRSEYRRAESEKFGTAVDLSSLREMYAIELIKAAKENLSGIGVQIKTANAAVRRVLEDALVKLGCGLEGDFCLHISADGKQLSVYSDEFGYIRHDKLLVLLCGDYFETEKELAVPYGAPKVLDEIAAQHGAKLYRYEDCPCDQSDEYARRLAVDAPFVRDGLLMAIKLLSYLKEHAVSIAEAVASIPKFGTANRFVSVAVNPTTILRKLGDGRQKIGEGLSLKVDKGDVRIRPVKSGKGVLLFAESASSETAEEICDFFENIVSGQEES